MKPRTPFLVHSDIDLPPSPCTNCGAMLDAGNCVKETDSKQRRKVLPKPGDFTVCISCGHIMAFDTELKLRDPQGDEFHKIAGDRRLLAIQWAIGQIKRK